ncbi:MAG: DUF2652 domain-containing protein [Flavobacterium sp.]|nr:MAG: DUF2652 domain-containing protein [Flavobacterium sp.]
MESNKQGIVFIPDISGYSKFVKNTDSKRGAKIISQLLMVIIQSNYLSFNISEIEGDAVLFYKYGDTYSISSILRQYETTLDRFNSKVDQLAVDTPEVRNLSLKVIVHFGVIEEISVKGFYKLYGNVVIEAHRLLKNNIGGHTYALITDAYLEANGESDFNCDNMGKVCEIYSEVGKICYSYFPYPVVC